MTTNLFIKMMNCYFYILVFVLIKKTCYNVLMTDRAKPTVFSCILVVATSQYLMEGRERGVNLLV